MELATLQENELIITLIAITILLFSAFLCGKLFEVFKAPKVVGEILGGMLLGGSCLHFFFPEIIEYIFKAYNEEGKVLNIFYQLGLIFLMFSSGFNTTIEVNRKNIKILSFLFIGATVIPMLIGLFFTNIFITDFIGTSNNSLAFTIVFVISIAITSIPVISKIFFDLGIMNTTFANIVLTTSTFQDLCLWIMLNTAINITSTNKFSLLNMLFITFITIGLFVVTKLISEHLYKIKLNLNPSDFLEIVFIILFFALGALSILKINIMYSAFIVGYITKMISESNKEFAQKVNSISDFSFSLFIPVYFALVGIQLNIIHNFSLFRFCLFFVIAFSLEAIGTVIMLLFTDLKKQSIINFAITMNARGGPGIVLATVSYYYKIINIEFFTVLILTTMLSSLLAGYWLRNQKINNYKFFENLR